MSLPLEKDQAHKLVDALPSDSTWEDLMHQIYVREAIEAGLKDSREGKATSVSEIRSKYKIQA